MTQYLNYGNTDGSTAALDFVRGWNEAVDNDKRSYAGWFEKLRAEGFGAAATDDGHVNRPASRLTLFFGCNPYGFTDEGKLGFGSKVALGTPDKYRVVVLLHHIPSRLRLGFGYADFAFEAHDPDKVYYAVGCEIHGRDEAKYYIHNKQTGETAEYCPPAAP